MRKCLIAITLLLPLLAGCCSPLVLRSDLQMLEDANSTLKGRKATITKADGERFHARDVVISAEMISWSASEESNRVSVPVDSVDAVRVSWRGTGALWGLLIGIGASEAIAAGMYFSDPSDYAGLVFIFMPPLGALIGAPAGAGSACREYDLTLLRQSAEQKAAHESD